MSFAALVFVLSACSGFVSIFVNDAVKRQDSFKVLKLLFKVTFGSGAAGGLLLLIIELCQKGLVHWPPW